MDVVMSMVSITVAVQSKAWTVFTCSNAGVMVSNPTRGMDVCTRLFCDCVVLCIERADPLSKESYRPCIGLGNWKSGQSPTKGCRAKVIIIIIITITTIIIIIKLKCQWCEWGVIFTYGKSGKLALFSKLASSWKWTMCYMFLTKCIFPACTRNFLSISWGIVDLGGILQSSVITWQLHSPYFTLR
jgi:hypothetical protein